jgi:hypothetical protein
MGANDYAAANHSRSCAARVLMIFLGAADYAVLT